MAYTVPLAVTTGSLATAAQYNTYTKDNIIAIYAGAMSIASQATGDLIYATSASQLGRIAAVAVGRVLASNGTSTVPVWTTGPSVTSLDAAGVIRSSALAGIPASGAGVEILYNAGGNVGTVQCYDRTGSAYKSLSIDGLTLIFNLSGVQAARFDATGSLQIAGTAARSGTAGTNRLDIFNGTAPVGTLTNGISLYSTTGELRVMDAAGNATLLSPHDHDTNEWIYYSKHTPTGHVLRIPMERLVAIVEQLSGQTIAERWIEV